MNHHQQQKQQQKQRDVLGVNALPPYRIEVARRLIQDKERKEKEKGKGIWGVNGMG